MTGKWYETGFEDGLKGLGQDAPWNPGHRDHTSYCEGFVDGERQAERELQEPVEEEA